MRMLLITMLALAGCAQQAQNETMEDATQVSEASTTESDSIAECGKRGVAYFKEIGSYPTLKAAPNKGRSAIDVVAERCGRTTTAF
ncbi:hypothetical protein [Sphingomonas sp. Ant20]|uniref:hypothetical protein n=1 Tax=Sphingomonas sp. Ant20 TaxID=104605 RepID=UPI000FE14329|nr:hypothetical protein [Sphingomonas sp. Ant20]